jgi:hypothetical protein
MIPEASQNLSWHHEDFLLVYYSPFLKKFSYFVVEKDPAWLDADATPNAQVAENPANAYIWEKLAAGFAGPARFRFENLTMICDFCYVFGHGEDHFNRTIAKFKPIS